MLAKTNELTGDALNWAVAECEGIDQDTAILNITCGDDNGWFLDFIGDWAQGGPIIEREGITIARRGEHSWSEWGAVLNNFEFDEEGPTPLIAAMRCYVASKLGEEIEIPTELKGA